MIYSYNKGQRDAQVAKFIWWSSLYITDRSTVHHQEYLRQPTKLAWQIPIACILLMMDRGPVRNM